MINIALIGCGRPRIPLQSNKETKKAKINYCCDLYFIFKAKYINAKKSIKPNNHHVLSMIWCISYKLIFR